jgi:hypothetical protein
VSPQLQNLIERCLQLYMSKGEVVRTLSNRARIEPGFTTLGEDFLYSVHLLSSLHRLLNSGNASLDHLAVSQSYILPAVTCSELRKTRLWSNECIFLSCHLLEIICLFLPKNLLPLYHKVSCLGDGVYNLYHKQSCCNNV